MTVVGVVFVSLLLGVISAAIAIAIAHTRTAIRNGAWRTHTGIGTRAANMHVKALVSLAGLFALDESEAVYFTAISDDDGDALTAAHHYVVEGCDVDARWWSITAYGSDSFLIANPAQCYAFNTHNVKRRENGSYRIHVGASARDENWLPTGKAHRFSLTLRLYNPGADVHAHLESIALPHIRKEVVA